MIVGIIFIQEGTRRIPIVSARQLGKGQSQNKTSYLTFKVKPRWSNAYNFCFSYSCGPRLSSTNN